MVTIQLPRKKLKRKSIGVEKVPPVTYATTIADGGLWARNITQAVRTPFDGARA